MIVLAKTLYENTVKFHNVLKERFMKKYSGSKKHPKRLYGRSDNPKDIFHHFRMVENEINREMSLLGYFMFKDGTLNLSGDIPEIH